MAPQIIVLCLMAFDLIYAANKHGQPRDENYNFWIVLTGRFITFLLLYLGGYFDNL